MHLKGREARKRLTYAPLCNINQVYKYFKDAKAKEDRRMFLIPYHFIQARAYIEKFRLDDEEEEGKDRTPEEKEKIEKAKMK